eukprot:764270-Hanusia_phi.AAC.3
MIIWRRNEVGCPSDITIDEWKEYCLVSCCHGNNEADASSKNPKAPKFLQAIDARRMRKEDDENDDEEEEEEEEEEDEEDGAAEDDDDSENGEDESEEGESDDDDEGEQTVSADNVEDGDHEPCEACCRDTEWDMHFLSDSESSSSSESATDSPDRKKQKNS